MRGQLLFLMLIPTFASAATDQEVKVTARHYASPQTEHESVMDEAAQSALNDWIALKETECRYLEPNDSGIDKGEDRAAHAEIFSIRGEVCSSGQPSLKPIQYCSAKVVCENPRIRFNIKDVFCRANKKDSCPEAKNCVLDTHLTRSLVNRAPVNNTAKQSGTVGQEMRGWAVGHTNQYSWTAMDEKDFQELRAKIIDRPPQE